MKTFLSIIASDARDDQESYAQAIIQIANITAPVTHISIDDHSIEVSHRVWNPLQCEMTIVCDLSLDQSFEDVNEQLEFFNGILRSADWAALKIDHEALQQRQ